MQLLLADLDQYGKMAFTLPDSHKVNRVLKIVNLFAPAWDLLRGQNRHGKTIPGWYMWVASIIGGPGSIRKNGIYPSPQAKS